MSAAKKVIKVPTRDCYRCPMCGKLVPFRWKDTFKEPHVVEIMIQTFVGGGRAGKGHGFKWDRRSCTSKELQFLMNSAKEACKRLSEGLTKLDQSE